MNTQPDNRLELCYRIFPRLCHIFNSDGFYNTDGYHRGVLVKCTMAGIVTYYKPRELLQWRPMK